MFEKTPKIVYFPELGSIWAPSQVSHARSCGLDCTPWSWQGVRPRGNSFPGPCLRPTNGLVYPRGIAGTCRFGVGLSPMAPHSRGDSRGGPAHLGRGKTP